MAVDKQQSCRVLVLYIHTQTHTHMGSVDACTMLAMYVLYEATLYQLSIYTQSTGINVVEDCNTMKFAYCMCAFLPHATTSGT